MLLPAKNIIKIKITCKNFINIFTWVVPYTIDNNWAGICPFQNAVIPSSLSIK